MANTQSEGVIPMDQDRLSQIEASFAHLWGQQLQPSEKTDQPPKRRKVNPPKHHSGQQNAEKGMMAIVRSMAILAIRHEDSINSQLTESSYVLYLNQASGLTSLLVKAGQAWSEIMKKGEAQVPLRCHLTKELANTMLHRFTEFQKMKEDPKVRTGALQSLLILETGEFPHLKWDAKRKKTVVDTQPAMKSIEMEARLKQLQELLSHPSNVIRFHALMNLSQQKEVVPWRLQVCTRDNALRDLMEALMTSSIWLLIGARVRPHSMQRSKLAQDLQDFLKGKEIS